MQPKFFRLKYSTLLMTLIWSVSWGQNLVPAGLRGKIFVGYQGWFNTPNDGSGRGWAHWNRDNRMENLTVDLWPDTSEFPPTALANSGLRLPNGSPAYLFSSAHSMVVDKHFEWMKQYNIAGVYLNWFLSDEQGNGLANRMKVLAYVRKSAEKYTRKFSLMIDISGFNSDVTCRNNTGQALKTRWMALVDQGVTSSPSYLRLNGLPLFSLWGAGFSHNSCFSPEAAITFANWIRSSGAGKYRATFLAGVPTYWRLLQGDSLSDPRWATFYAKADIISPWLVGRFENSGSMGQFIDLARQDIGLLKARGQHYLPVIWPGFSWHNLMKATGRGNSREATPNLIPRLGGTFLWKQAFEFFRLGLPSFYIAMFDEVDEGTAIFKVAKDVNSAPTNVYTLTLDQDGFKIKNDHYLELVKELTLAMEGRRAMTEAIPPLGLTAHCPQGALHLSWSYTGDQSFFVRVDDPSNNRSSCIDGWLCPGGFDRAINDYPTNNYSSPQIYGGKQLKYWVHSFRNGVMSAPVSGAITCQGRASQPSPPLPTSVEISLNTDLLQDK